MSFPPVPEVSLRAPGVSVLLRSAYGSAPERQRDARSALRQKPENPTAGGASSATSALGPVQASATNSCPYLRISNPPPAENALQTGR